MAGTGPYETAVVTGASRGIGAAIVRAMCAEGIAVTAVARSTDSLAALREETGCKTLSLDLSDMAATVEALSAQDADILVNNAGAMTQSAPFVELALEELETSVDVNLKGALGATRALLPGMVERGRGHVFFITSMFGPYAAPNASVYAATKAGLRAFVNCLRLDLAGSGVRVTEIAPGRVQTEFFSASFGNDREAMARTLFEKYRALAPEDVATALMGALNLPPHADVNRIEITSTDQALGGAVYATRPGSDG